MLVVFHLGWDRFDIDQKVSVANRKINGIAQDKQAGNMMIFNLASLGAGEIIIDRKERIQKSREKDPEFDSKLAERGVSDVSYERPPERTIDYIRRRHWRIARDLDHDNQFKAYRDAAEMLSALRTRGHQLAAVFTGASKEAEQGLKRARALDYFEEHVYGYDSLKDTKTLQTAGQMYRHAMSMLALNPQTATSAEDTPTAGALFKHAMKMQKTAAVDSVIVADSKQAIKDAVALKPMAVAGYLDPYLGDREIDQRLVGMYEAGAQYAVVGGHGISSLPDYLHGTRQLQSQRDLVMKKLGFDLQ